jgi:hypothetical protein
LSRPVLIESRSLEEISWRDGSGSAMDYDDLVIQLGAGEAGGYTVRVSRSPAGESDPEPLVVPVTEDEIDRLAAAFGRAARDLRLPTAGEISEASLAALGDRLFRALLPEAAKNCYYQSVGQIAARADRGLRLRLQMGLGSGAMARLHAVPWEYLHSPVDGFLARRRKISIVRHLDLEIAGDRPPAPTPMAILAVACVDPALDLARERHAIEDALRGKGRARLKLLPNASLDALREELLARDYHVLHLMGHGGFDPAAGEGSLALRSDSGRRVWVGGPDLAEQVRDVSSLRLVVLNACWTARTSAAGPYAGVATAMLKAGIPAVVAMQFAITDAAALAFSRTFYRRLACGDAIDAAVTEGRLAIRHSNRQSLEWGTPVLFERLTGGVVVEPARSAPRSWPPSWRRWAAAALALLASQLLPWKGLDRRQLEPVSQPAVSRSTGIEAAIGATRRQKPVRPAGARIYNLTAGENVLVEELASQVIAEFPQGGEHYLTLHIRPPMLPALGSVPGHYPALDRIVTGATDIAVDLKAGTGHLVVLGIDWSRQGVKLSAEPEAPPVRATAQCLDGTYSFSASRGGTCSSHEGVARWLPAPGIPPP